MDRSLSGSDSAKFVVVGIPARAITFETGSRQVDVPARSAPHELALTPGEWRVISACLGLSPRQSEIVRVIIESPDELTEADIASRIAMTRRTVHAHLERLYRKLGIHSRYQLVQRLFTAYLWSCAGRVVEPE